MILFSKLKFDFTNKDSFFVRIFHCDSLFVNDVYADSDNYTNGEDEMYPSPFGSDDEGSLTENDNEK